MNRLLTFVIATLTLTSCTKEILVEVPVETIIKETIVLTEYVTETVTQTIEIEVEAQPTVIDTGYVFDLSEYNNIANVVLFKEIAGSEAYRTFNYKQLGELDALIEQGYIVLENNSCCIDEANAYLVISTWDGTRDVFHFTIVK